MQRLFCLFFLLMGPSALATSWTIGIALQAEGTLRKPAYEALDALVNGFAGQKADLQVFVQIHSADEALCYRIDHEGLHMLTRSTLSDFYSCMHEFCMAVFGSCSSQLTMLIMSGHGSGILQPQWNQQLKRWVYQPDEGESYYADYCLRKNKLLSDIVFKACNHKSIFLGATKNNCLSPLQLAHMLGDILQDRKIDIIGFDACHMGMIEVAYDLRTCARLMIGSQECEENDGWDYGSLISLLKGESSPFLVARSMVYAYEKSQRSKQHTTFSLSVFDLAIVDSFTVSLQSVVQHLERCLKVYKNELHDLLCLVRQKNQRFCFIPMYADVYCFFNTLYEELFTLQTSQELEYLKIAVLDLLETHRRMIIASVAGTACLVGGSSVYFPFNAVDQAYAQNTWPHASSWSFFLGAFIAKQLS